MRTILSTLILVFLLASQSFAEKGVSKVKKSKLKIDKIGTVTSEVNEIITANIKASRSSLLFSECDQIKLSPSQCD